VSGRRALRIAALTLAIGALAWLGLLRLVPKPLLVNRPGFSQQVTARDGSLLRLTLTSDERYRLFVPLDEIPEPVIAATLLQEDRHFFRHPGINPVALLRAVRETYVEGGRRVGGSTLTMQVARLRFGLVTRTARGKLLQILRALQLELFYTKREILEAYLNLAPYGANVEGVGAASRIWFGKGVGELELAEALALAVLPKSPAARSPHTADGRTQLTAAAAALNERLHASEGRDASAGLAALALRERAELPFLAPHLADRVVAEHPFERRLDTTLDPRVQRLAERQVRLHVARGERFGIRNAAVLIVDHRSMETLAYVGSADHADRAILGAVDGIRGRRSPGSALKPLLYGLAIDAGLIHPQSLLRDASLTLSAWNPENFERDFLGPISATDALVRSRNLPAVQLAADLPAPGLHGFLGRAGVGGLRTAGHYGLALALGGVELRLDELVSLYALLANGGVLRPLELLRAPGWPRAVSAAGEEPQLLSREASHLVLEMLRANPRPGAVTRAGEPRGIHGVPWKTGTSWGFRDAWALGLVGPYVVGVWVGNFDGTPNPAFVGRHAAGPLLFRIADALRELPGAALESPPGELALVRTQVCALSGAVPRAACPSRKTTWAIPGVSPIAPCTIHREVEVEMASGLRACPGTARSVRRVVYEFWPSDLLTLFRSAGIARRTPPPFAAECRADGSVRLARGGGTPLRIESPQARVVYQLRSAGGDQIPLHAVSDADGRRIDWFVNDAWVGRVASGDTLLWRARPGRFTVRAVDDLGRAQTRRIEIAGVD
jgi:penicillin-binding protein 1C